MQAGVGPGETVALWLNNRPEWLHILFAVAKVGETLVPVNTRFRTSDLAYVLRHSDATTLITADVSGPGAVHRHGAGADGNGDGRAGRWRWRSSRPCAE